MKAKKSMKTDECHSLLEDSDLRVYFSNNEGITGNMNVHDGGARKAGLQQAPIVKKKSEEDSVNLYDIPEWPGSAQQVDIQGNKPAAHIEISEVKGSKSDRHREISLWDIPQCPVNHDDPANPAGMATFAEEDTNSSIGNPGFASLAFSQPSAFQYQPRIPQYDNYYDDDSYYHSLLLRKKQILLEMQICLQRQAIIDAKPDDFDFQAFMQDAAEVKVRDT